MAIFLNAIVGLIQLVVSILFAVVALYAGFYVFHLITGGFDAAGEIKKGNIAVGILVASIFIGISIAVDAGVRGILDGLSNIVADGTISLSDSVYVLSSLTELALGILLAVAAIYGVMYITARVSPTLDMLREIKYGNAGVASVVASMIIAVSAIIHYGVAGIVGALF